MTPLEIARQRERDKDKIVYCDQCDKCVKFGNTFYCDESGKILLPYIFERSQGNGPSMSCENMEWKKRKVGDAE